MEGSHSAGWRAVYRWCHVEEPDGMESDGESEEIVATSWATATPLPSNSSR